MIYVPILTPHGGEAVSGEASPQLLELAVQPSVVTVSLTPSEAPFRTPRSLASARSAQSASPPVMFTASLFKLPVVGAVQWMA